MVRDTSLYQLEADGFLSCETQNARQQSKCCKFSLPDCLSPRSAGAGADPQTTNTVSFSKLTVTSPRPQLRTLCRNSWETYSNDRFLTTCTRNLRFRWPHALESLHRLEGNMLRFTDRFRRRLHDATYWAMGQEFGRIYPETRGMYYVFEEQPCTMLDRARPLNCEEAR